MPSAYPFTYLASICVIAELSFPLANRHRPSMCSHLSIYLKGEWEAPTWCTCCWAPHPLAYDDCTHKDVILTMILFSFSAFSSRSPMMEHAHHAHHTNHLSWHPQSTDGLSPSSGVKTNCLTQCSFLSVNTHHPQPCLCPRSYILCFNSMDHLDVLLFQRHNHFQIFLWLNDCQQLKPARMGFSPKEALQPAVALSTSGGYK